MSTLKKYWKWYFILLFSVAVFSIVSTLQLISYIHFSSNGIEGIEQSESGRIIFESPALLWSILISSLSGAVLLILILIKIDYFKNTPITSILKKNSIFKWLSLAIVLVLVKELVFRLTDINNDFLLRFLSEDPSIILMLLTFGVIGPTFEELIYRFFLYEGIKLTKLGHKGAIIITSILFAISHLQYDPILALAIFGFGLIYGVCRYKTGHIIYPILMHVAVNLLDLILTMLLL